MTGPLAGTALWRRVIGAAGEVCQCAGECRTKHRDGRGKPCSVAHGELGRHGRVHLIAAPEDASLTILEAAQLPAQRLVRRRPCRRPMHCSEQGRQTGQGSTSLARLRFWTTVRSRVECVMTRNLQVRGIYMNQEMLSIPDAAKRLSVTERTAYRLIGAGRLTTQGRPVRIDSRDVARLVTERQREAAQARPDRAAFARQVMERLHPHEPDPLYARSFEYVAFLQQTKGTEAVTGLHPDARAMWGDTALRVAAQTWPVDACKTCFAAIGARVLGAPEPRNTEDWRILLGHPCAKDRRRWADEEAREAAVQRRGAEIQAQQEREAADAAKAQEVADAKARVRRDTAIIAAGTARTVAVTRGGVTSAAQPVGDQDGADFVAAQRQKLLKRREDAANRGDARRHAEITAQLKRLGS